jgi:CRISPR-associated protein Csh2
VIGKEEDVVATLIDKCIDVRAFGGVFPVGGKAYNLTGSIQFKMTKSLHEVKNPTYIKGTGAFASTEGANQKTFREEYILPYALFGTYGVVNGLNSSNTKLTANDVDEVVESLVMGTKNLITRSKMGQYPRFLLKINYKENGFFIGELDNRIKIAKIDNRVDAESDIRSVDDYTIDMSKIEKLLKKYSDRVESIKYFVDDSFEDKITIPKSWIKILD